MTQRSPREQLQYFRRKGQRTYKEAKSLLVSHGFEKRDTTKNHVLWQHENYKKITITIVRRRTLAYRCKKLVQTAVEDYYYEVTR